MKCVWLNDIIQETFTNLIITHNCTHYLTPLIYRHFPENHSQDSSLKNIFVCFDLVLKFTMFFILKLTCDIVFLEWKG